MKRLRTLPIEKPAAAAVVAAAILFLAYAATSEEAVCDALRICSAVIVPSLFPYMVVSSLIVRFGAAKELGRIFAVPTGKLLRLPGSAAGAVLLGALCGFPVGARSACELYERGEIGREDAERLIAVANNTGPAFVVEVIGAHYWGNRLFGLFLYAAQILSALLIGAVAAHLSHSSAAPDDVPPPAHKTVRSDLLTSLADAVSSSALSVIAVCGFIVFFAVVTAIGECLLRALHLDFLTPFAAVFLEFSSGCAKAASLGGYTGAFLTGFAVGWSGISVFAQSKVFTAPNGIRLRRTALSKFVQGILCGAAGCLGCSFLPVSASLPASISQPISPYPFLTAELLLLVAFCFLPFALPHKKGRRP